jgi:hypothetical protein
MRRPLLLCLALTLSAAGCRSRCDLVEAELRTKDRELRELRGELMRAETMNEALENTLKDQRCGAPPGVVARPAAGALAQVKDIQLGRGTGGIDEDRIPGDEGIQVVLVPRDIDGSPIKAPGNLKIIAAEITPEGLKVPLSTWDVSALQLRRSWRSGLLSTGYFVALPWQKVPTTEKLRIVAQFFPLEGGAFEAERDVTIHLLPEAQHGPGPIMAPAGLGPPTGLAPPVPLEGQPAAPALPAPAVPTLPPPEPIPAPMTPGTQATPTNASRAWQPARPAELLPPRPALPPS